MERRVSGFRRLLRLAPRGRREAALIETALDRLEESPTARELMEEFERLRARARISVEAFPDSEVVRRDGRRILMGSAAQCSDGRPLRVELNRDALRMDRRYRLASVPGHIGHELLGHVLEQVKAERAGVGDVYHHYRHNETNAAVVGWLVKAELGADPADVEQDDMRRLLGKGMAFYHRSLQARMPYYAVTFSLAEMRRPVAVLERRLARVRRLKRSEARAGRGGGAAWRWQARIEKELEGYIRYWSCPDGRSFVARLRAGSRSAFLREAERTVARRLRRLRALTRGAGAARP